MKKQLLTFLIVTLLTPMIHAEGSVIVLCYHTFLGKAQYTTDFSTNEFYEQMKAISDLGYQFVSFNDIMENRIRGDNNVLITIDDGNKSVLNVWDTFETFDIEPVLFIYPAIVDLEFNYALKFDQIAELLKKEVTIGAHGYSHLFVNQDLYDSDYTAFKREIYSAKKLLDLELDTDVNLYAYPYGDYSEVTIEHLHEAGYLYSFTINHGRLLVPLERNDDLFQLPRYLVSQDTWEDVYAVLEEDAENQKLSDKTVVSK